MTIEHEIGEFCVHDCMHDHLTINTVTTLVSPPVKPSISTGWLLVFTGGAYKGGYGMCCSKLRYLIWREITYDFDIFFSIFLFHSSRPDGDAQAAELSFGDSTDLPDCLTSFVLYVFAAKTSINVRPSWAFGWNVCRSWISIRSQDSSRTFAKKSTWKNNNNV